MPMTRNLLSFLGLGVATVAMSVVAPPSAFAGADKQLPVSINAQMAAHLVWKQDRPEYPALARVNYIHGHVIAQLFVAPDGRVAEVHVIAGHPFLALAVVKAVRRWIYHPYNPGGGPRAFSTTVEVNFELGSKAIGDLPPTPERDLNARVQPPELEDPPITGPGARHVQMVLLVDDSGKVADSRVISGPLEAVPAARRKVSRWTFHPARWGAMAVPWYVVTDVGVESSTRQASVAAPTGP